MSSEETPAPALKPFVGQRVMTRPPTSLAHLTDNVAGTVIADLGGPPGAMVFAVEVAGRLVFRCGNEVVFSS